MTLPEATVAALAVDGSIAREVWTDLRLRPELAGDVVVYHVLGDATCAPIVAATLPRRDRRASDWVVRAPSA